jgi:hypothetical protein
MSILIEEIDNELVNVKWFKIPPTKTALRNGYTNCIEKHYIYKENGNITITRHMSETIEQIFEQEDTYYHVFNGHRLSTAKK